MHSDVRCCFTQDEPSKSGGPFINIAVYPQNIDAGSHVIDASEPQPEKHSSPMTVTEAGR
jgi:hypothetical protein